MQTAPLILVTPSTEEKGVEFYDYSISLSETYLDCITHAGGLPVVVPCAPSQKVVAEYVRRCDGVIITGGDDIQPELYWPDVPAKLRKTVGRNDAVRDLLETLIVKEAFAQQKPLLAICRGHQILNITLGGTLFVDIPSQVTTDINHSRLKQKDRVVHRVILEDDSLIRRVFGKSEIEVNSSHHQAVDKVAKPLRVTGRAPDGVIEVLELRPEDAGLMPYLLAVQFHPERLTRGYPEYEELFRSFTEACVINRAREEVDEATFVDRG
ncbi:MAG TPA: gamma-glutamyl-gamma-aminobutyrate hydrolase family protein [Verrucomicrobiae bacterium]